MSEAPSRPPEPDPSVTAPAAPSQEGGPAAAASDVTSLEAPQLYRPLSLLSVLSVVLSGAYALVILVGGLMPFYQAAPRRFVVFLLLGPIVGGLVAVLLRQKTAERIAAIAAVAAAAVLVLMGLGGLIAFSGSSPWEPGAWTWGLLLAALLTSFLALAQIRSSEGALAGRVVARCGLYLGLFFGGFYLLYLAGNHLAVANQAQTVSDRFLDHVRKDQLPEAFLETLKPGSRPSGNLRSQIEEAFNTPRGRDPGEFSSFSTSPLVQLIRLGSKDETTITHLGTAPEYVTDATYRGYVAQGRYLIKNDLGHFEVLIQAHSVDVAGRREWQIILGRCRIERTVEESPLFKEMGQARGEADFVVRHWLMTLSSKQPQAAYLQTLPAEQRRGMGRALLLGRPELSAQAGPAPAMALEGLAKDRADLEEGTKEFLANRDRSAGFVDDSQFFTFAKTKEERDAQKQEVIDFLGQSNKVPAEAMVLAVGFADTWREGDEVVVARPVRFGFQPIREGPNARPPLFVEAEVFCRGKPGKPGDGQVLDRYRITKVRLMRAAIPPATGGPPVPRG
jgi:hypothetical protein